VTAFEAARGNIFLAGRALRALQRGEKSREALVGGMLQAENYAMIRAFLTKK